MKFQATGSRFQKSFKFQIPRRERSRLFEACYLEFLRNLEPGTWSFQQ